MRYRQGLHDVTLPPGEECEVASAFVLVTAHERAARIVDARLLKRTGAIYWNSGILIDPPAIDTESPAHPGNAFPEASFYTDRLAQEVVDQLVPGVIFHMHDVVTAYREQASRFVVRHLYTQRTDYCISPTLVPEDEIEIFLTDRLTARDVLRKSA